VLAWIGLSFLAEGIQLHADAVRTTAAVADVRQVHDEGRAGGYHYEFTLEFADRHGRHRTEQTEQVRNQPLPNPGDRVKIYYASGNPSNLADVRLGSPGAPDFVMASMFAALTLATPFVARCVRFVRERLRARRRRELIG
jgi:hypothetical protein